MNRELDKFIAEKVMGLEVVVTESYNKKRDTSHIVYTIGKPDYYDDRGELILFNPLPNYSEDIDLGFEVVEKLGIYFSITHEKGIYTVMLVEKFVNDWGPKPWNPVLVSSNNPAEAICLAAKNLVDRSGK